MKNNVLALSSFGLLDLAIGVEASNARLYREWADRFLPFNADVSRLFEDMAFHSDRYGDDLRSSRADLYAGPIELGSPGTREVEARPEITQGTDEHFFVVDKSTAHRILTLAVNTLSKARYFYKSILVTTRNSFLRKACRPRTLPEVGHVVKLHRFLEQY